MSIDWITVSAQLVNFLILVWLLKHFLYQPVMQAMERREQRIAERLSEAHAREQRAAEEAGSYHDEREALERRRDEILAQAREEAEAQKKRMLEDGRRQAGEVRDSWRRQVNQEKEEFLGNLRRQAAQAVQSIARKALADLADVGLEAHVIDGFIAQLRALDQDERNALVDRTEPVSIVSAFELGGAVRGRLTRAVHECLAQDVDLVYSQSPDLICGIELTSGGRRLSWNVAEYMEDLAQRIEESFKLTASVAEET
jgi:F-type H+-transporting ATPase subunit b